MTNGMDEEMTTRPGQGRPEETNHVTTASRVVLGIVAILVVLALVHFSRNGLPLH